MLDPMNQECLGFRQIGHNPEPRRVGQGEAAVDKGREGFGQHRLQRILHRVMLKQPVTADGGQHMRGRLQADT